MDSERLFGLAVGVVLLAGVGMSATTLQSTVETSPDDVIDVDDASLPLSSEAVGEYADRLDSNSDSSSAPGGRGSPSEPAGGPDGDRSGQSGDSDGQRQGAPGSDDGDRSGGSQPGDGDLTGKQRKPADGDQHMPGDQSLLAWLLSLLRALLAALLRALPVLLALGLVALAVANRDRIAAALSERFGDDTGPESDDDGPTLRAVPRNEVSRAWYEMAALVDGDGDAVETATPRECADRAVAAGADRSAVERITRTFEEVRYGHAEVTSDRRERARDGLDSVRSQLGVNR